MKLFTLKGLAKLDGVSYDSLRRLLMGKTTGFEWRWYRFIHFPGKLWLAYEKEEKVELIDDE